MNDQKQEKLNDSTDDDDIDYFHLSANFNLLGTSYLK